MRRSAHLELPAMRSAAIALIVIALTIPFAARALVAGKVGSRVDADGASADARIDSVVTASA